MSKCELCKATARIHCDSDQAMLCWNCDATVHSANFLVARHFRNLLCHVCHSPTPWNASGSRLNPGVSICTRCFTGCHRTKVTRFRLQNEYIEKVLIDENGGDEEDELITATTAATSTTTDDVPPPPPSAVSSSSSEGSSRRFWKSDRPDHNSLKRMRGNNPDLTSDDEDDDDDDDCSSCLRGFGSGFSELSSRALKLQRVETYEEEKSGSKSAIAPGDDATPTVTIDGGIWERRRNDGSVDLVDSSC